MAEAYSLRAAEWADVVEVLHGLLNVVTVRAHYPVGHPAITRADDLAYAGFAKMLERLPEIVLALLDGEFVVCERPMPDLRSRLPGLADVMTRQNVECLVFQRGLSRAECSVLAETLTAAVDPARPHLVRERVQANLQHVLVRFAEIRKQDLMAGAGAGVDYVVPIVAELFDRVKSALASDVDIDRNAVRQVARRVLDRIKARSFALEVHCHGDGLAALAVHATNVATMTAAMAVEAEYPEEVALEATAAGLMHDIGRLFLPAEVRDVPEPALDDKARAVFRQHPFLGARALLLSGCPATWVAAALEHHRGVDGAGYPPLSSNGPPDEVVRHVSLACFFDSKRTIARGKCDEPEEVLRQAWSLAGRYFDRASLRRFTRALGVHPPGTTVELSNREAAIVLRANQHDALAPEVRLLTGPQAGKRVDLKTFNAIERRHELALVRSIAPPILLPGEIALAAAAEKRAEAKLKSKPALAPPASPPPALPPPASKPKARTDPDMKELYQLFSHDKSDPLDSGVVRPSPSGTPAVSATPKAPVASVPSKPPAVSVTPKAPAVTASLSGSAGVRAVVPAPPSAPPSPRELDHVYAAIDAEQRRPSSGAPPLKPVSRPLVPTARPTSTSGSYSSVSRRSTSPATSSSSASRRPVVGLAPSPGPAPAPASAPVSSKPPEAGQASSLEAALARIGSLSRVPKLAVDPRALGGLGLDHKAGFILSLVDGASSLETIVDVSGQQQVEVLRLIEELVARGVLKLS